MLQTWYGLLHYDYMTRRTCLLFRICLPLRHIPIMFIKRTTSFPYRSPFRLPYAQPLVHKRTIPYAPCFTYTCYRPCSTYDTAVFLYMYINRCTVTSNLKFDLVCLCQYHIPSHLKNVVSTPFIIALEDKTSSSRLIT